jgi:hypothetical protein
LGRPVQTVQKGFSPSGADLADYQEYDKVGRESKKWLPASVSGNNGSFVPLNTLMTHASGSYPGETKPYALPVYESSPLNRVLEQYGPGQAWQNNSRSAKTVYLTNISDNDTLNCCMYLKPSGASTDTLFSIFNGEHTPLGNFMSFVLQTKTVTHLLSLKTKRVRLYSLVRYYAAMVPK